MPQHYLGIDVGTTAVKALVVNELGSVVGEAESPLEVSVPRHGWAEQNPSDWWQGTVHAVRAACAQADIHEVESIGLSGQMHSSVVLGRCGHGAQARDTVERRSHHRPVPPHNRQCRQDGPASAGRQPRPRGIHRAQAAVDARRAAQPVRAGTHAPSAKGLCAPDYDRREGNRAFRRRWHPAVRHTAGSLVGRDDRRAPTRSRDSPTRPTFDRRDRRTHDRCR